MPSALVLVLHGVAVALLGLLRRLHAQPQTTERSTPPAAPRVHDAAFAFMRPRVLRVREGGCGSATRVGRLAGRTRGLRAANWGSRGKGAAVAAKMRRASATALLCHARLPSGRRERPMPARFKAQKRIFSEYVGSRSPATSQTLSQGQGERQAQSCGAARPLQGGRREAASRL